MKRLLITGGLGFVGSHIVEGVLKQTDWQIIILDKYSYAGNFNRLTDIDCWKNEKHRIKIIYHDLRAPIFSTTSQMIGEIDYIFHLAAESHVERSLQDSIPFIESNVLGTANLLEWVKHEHPKTKTFIFSTDEVFGPASEGIFFKENDQHRPSNPYSGSKSGEEAIAFSFAHSFNLPIIITRSMNIIGERQHPEKFVPKTIRAILKNELVAIHGVPGRISSRCWIHARNVCDALLFLVEKAIPQEAYHIVGEERDVFYLANRISQIIRGRDLIPEKEIQYIDFHANRPGHDFRYALSGEKLAKMGWKLKSSLEDSFDKMTKWMIEPKNKKWLNL